MALHTGAVAHPPPSTLAAQLVFSASTRSSRSEDHNELRRLSATIQAVERNPDLLKTPQDQLDHNHLLTYVFIRAVLDGIKLEDPLLDPQTIRTEVLKAINFLILIVKETPNVLTYTSEKEEQYDLRGTEPLWLWLLPKLLRFLGHRRCLDVTEDIQGFFSDLLALLGPHGHLGDLSVAIVSYLRQALDGLLLLMKDLPTANPDATISHKFPDIATLQVLIGPDDARETKHSTYTITQVAHAIRHTSSLATILSRCFGSPDRNFHENPTLCAHKPWLLDSLLSLRLIHAAWQTAVPVPHVETLQNTLGLLSSSQKGLNSIASSKAFTLLALHCVDIAQNSEGVITGDDAEAVQARTVFSEALLQLAFAASYDRNIGRLASSKIVFSLETLAVSHPGLAQPTDFWKCAQLLKRSSHSSLVLSASSKVPQDPLDSADLRQLAEKLALTESPSHEIAPPPKRVKLTSEPTGLPEVYARIQRALGSPPEEGNLAFQVNFMTAFPNVDEPSQSLAIDLVSRLGCVADGALLDASSTTERPKYNCKYCANVAGAGPRPKTLDSQAKYDALLTFIKLLSHEPFLNSQRLRVSAMVSARRLMVHTDNIAVYALERSKVGQWSLQSLTSSVRELRIAAGRTLAQFSRPFPSETVPGITTTENRQLTLQCLRKISEQDDLSLSETTIMAWGQIGRIVSGDELNVVLHQLLGYLGGSNTLVASCAFSEIVSMAAARKVSCRKLFEPFWGTLAYVVVKDLIPRPQISRAVADLMQLSVNQLLLLIQSHALPWLVLMKKKDVVHKIIEARQDDARTALLESRNHAPIMARLLMQDVPDLETFVMSRLREFSAFESCTLVDLMKGEAVPIVIELLKAAGDSDEVGKVKIRRALTWMCSKLLAETQSSSSHSKKGGNVVGHFLEHYMLGLMASLADVINDRLSSSAPIEEQKRCLRAMEEMIIICRRYVREARPQISACLLSAMDHDSLRPAAFKCWFNLLLRMDDEDVEVLVEPTFFIVNYYWSLFDPYTQIYARQLVSDLYDQFRGVMAAFIDKLPHLGHIPALEDVEKKLSTLRKPQDQRSTFRTFAARLSHQNSGVAQQALTELVTYLQDNQVYLQTSAVSGQPDTVVAKLIRSLLDCAAKHSTSQPEIASLCTQCLGLVGCLDSNRIETTRTEKSMVVLTNFEDSNETTNFALFILQEVLVKAFLSTTDTKLQGYLSFTMQELMARVDISVAVAVMDRTTDAEVGRIYSQWLQLPEDVREVLRPFLGSSYMLAPGRMPIVQYPIFRSGRTYHNWMRAFVLDLLQKGQNPNAVLVFEPLTRVIRVKDLYVAEFLLPYLVLHIIVADTSTKEQREVVVSELVNILKHEPPEGATYHEREDMKLYYEAVFGVLDYASRWILAKTRVATREDRDSINRVQSVVDTIAPELRSQRAVYCKQYSRALFYLEHHAQELEVNKGDTSERNRLFAQLQEIYTQIDEPDGLEGISARLQVLDVNQQILGHKKAGRWSAAQTWYEIKLAEEPNNVDTQVDLLTCLKQSGQHDVLLNYVEGMRVDASSANKIIPFAVEAAWATTRWDTLSKYAGRFNGDMLEDFNVSLAELFGALQRGPSDRQHFTQTLQSMREKLGSAMTHSATSSLQTSHELRLRCHVLTDLEMIAGTRETEGPAHQAVLANLDRRLEILGAYVHDKQYLLGIRRAAMELSRPVFNDLDVSSLWLSSARLARKSNSTHQALNAVLHASQLGDESAVIENARLLWKDGHTRKAIQVLQNAIDTNKFATQVLPTAASSSRGGADANQRLITARAQLTLAKWLDSAGQTHILALREKYQQVPKTISTWEKGHFFLGRHYKKLMESQSALDQEVQIDAHVQGELARLVIENYLRALSYGTKYLYQALPRVMNLWLDLGGNIDKSPNGRMYARELQRRRTEQLGILHKFLDKYCAKLPAYMFYTALPQIVARIAHPNPDVFERLNRILVRVVEAYPRQSLWGLFGIMTTKQQSLRRERGQKVVHSLLRGVGSSKVDGSSLDLKTLIRQGEKLSEQLLAACNNGKFTVNRTMTVGLSKDLGFNHNCAPCALVVPVEKSLTATLPALTDHIRRHRAFSRDTVTIESFLEEVLVLSSLARPRRLTARGSDGNNYMLMIKPKDDLRTDQRLMEFNAMINRSLKRDAESSRRQLYIRTYAVTPLNEECGIIEWVGGLKTLREVLLEQYRQIGITPDYMKIKVLMRDATAKPDNIERFTEDVVGGFPPRLPHWYIQQFPHPAVWFSARIRYTRTLAVMSMVGTILGLGDRHAENVLLEKNTGGILHVDFNCLFDKGKTFQEPERVPFRLTHNMVAAMGSHGYEGPFRACSELTLGILRQQEETLMTILEAFIYDPTLDLQKVKKTGGGQAVKPPAPGEIRLEPRSVVESIRRKVKGLLPNESIPLSVEGHVEELIKEAVSPVNLTRMYIGWCPFL